MEQAEEKLSQIVEKMNSNPKAQAVFVTNIAGKDIDGPVAFFISLY